MKKILLLLTLLALTATSAMAQAMSDTQVIQFVQAEQEKGSNQQTIVQKLMRRGITPEQLRRVRKKYEAEQSQPGAKSSKKNSSRMRSSYQLEGQDGAGKQTRQEREREMGEELSFLSPDSLTREQIDEKNAVFGRNIFNNEYLTFEPNQNMATPANYKLGAGDKVIIDVWGNAQETFESPISPDGYVVIDGVGPIRLAGLSVTQATQRVKQTLGQYYSGCHISLAVGETRSIQVQVVGEVVAPGTYTLSSLSTAFNALYAAGGINQVGTLRDIKVYREGRQISTIDVYDYLLNGNTKGDVRLQDNDVITVGPYDCLVNVRGKVKRPMWYEMKRDESVKQVLNAAGGFTGDAYTKNIRLTRKAGDEYSMHTVDEFKMAAFTLMDGDSIFVDSVIARFSNMVEVRGAVKHAGQYQLGGDVQTVRELLRAAEGLREDAFTSRCVMHREKDDLTLEMLSIDLEGILAGTAADVPLKKGDMLFVPSRVDMKGEQTLRISGEVIYPGTYQFADNTTVEDLILMAGGLTPAASMAKVDVFRRIQDFTATETKEATAETFSFALNDGLRVGETQFVLLPFDEVVVRRSPAYSVQENVQVQGCVNFEGNYTMTSKNYRLSDLVKAAGGLSALAYAKGARLTRRLTDEERLQRENSLRAAQIQMYEEAMQSEKAYDLNKADSLLSLKLDIGDTYPVAVNLDKALQKPGSPDDIVLRKGDVLTIPQFTNTVKVSGEVTYPISMNFQKGSTVRSYVRQAGGFANRAKKKGTYVIYMNGAVEKTRLRSRKAVQPGSELVVPTKKNGTKMSTGEIMAISSGGASLASVVVALISILRK